MLMQSKEAEKTRKALASDRPLANAVSRLGRTHNGKRVHQNNCSDWSKEHPAWKFLLGAPQKTHKRSSGHDCDPDQAKWPENWRLLCSSMQLRRRQQPVRKRSGLGRVEAINRWISGLYLDCQGGEGDNGSNSMKQTTSRFWCLPSLAIYQRDAKIAMANIQLWRGAVKCQIANVEKHVESAMSKQIETNLFRTLASTTNLNSWPQQFGGKVSLRPTAGHLSWMRLDLGLLWPRPRLCKLLWSSIQALLRGQRKTGPSLLKHVTEANLREKPQHALQKCCLLREISTLVNKNSKTKPSAKLSSILVALSNETVRTWCCRRCCWDIWKPWPNYDIRQNLRQFQSNTSLALWLYEASLSVVWSSTPAQRQVFARNKTAQNSKTTQLITATDFRDAFCPWNPFHLGRPECLPPLVDPPSLCHASTAPTIQGEQPEEFTGACREFLGAQCTHEKSVDSPPDWAECPEIWRWLWTKCLSNTLDSHFFGNRVWSWTWFGFRSNIPDGSLKNISAFLLMFSLTFLSLFCLSLCRLIFTRPRYHLALLVVSFADKEFESWSAKTCRQCSPLDPPSKPPSSALPAIFTEHCVLELLAKICQESWEVF